MTQSSSSFKWIAWISVSFFYAYQYIIRVLPSVLMPDLMEKFQMDASLFGQFSGIYYIGYGLAHLPLGLLLDRVGPKIIIPLCSLLCILGLCPLLFETVWIAPFIGRCLIGIGSSGAILGVFKIVRMVFPQEKFSQMLGMSVTIGLLGAIYGSKPLNHLITLYGWEVCVRGLILSGGLLSFWMYLAMPTLGKKERVSSSLWGDLKKLLSSKTALLISLLAGFMVAPLEGFADIWGTEYLMRLYDFSKSEAAVYPSLIFIGMGVGAPFLGSLSEKYKAYFTVISLSGAIMLSLFLALLYAHLPFWALPGSLFIIGIFCAYQIPAIAKATLFVPPSLMGLTTAFANMVIMLFGYLYHGLIGGMMRYHQSLSLTEVSSDSYSLNDFVAGLTVIPIGLFIGILGFIWLGYKVRQR